MAALNKMFDDLVFKITIQTQVEKDKILQRLRNSVFYPREYLTKNEEINAIKAAGRTVLNEKIKTLTEQVNRAIDHHIREIDEVERTQLYMRSREPGAIPSDVSGLPRLPEEQHPGYMGGRRKTRSKSKKSKGAKKTRAHRRR